MPTPDCSIAPAVLDHLLAGLVAVMPEDGQDPAARLEVVRALVLAAQPADAMAAALVVQALAAHYGAMDAHLRAKRADDPAKAARQQSAAATLARTTRAMLDAATARGKEAEPPAQRRAEPAQPRRSTKPPQAEPPVVRAYISPTPVKLWDELTMEERRARYGYRSEEEIAADKAKAPPAG